MRISDWSSDVCSSDLHDRGMVDVLQRDAKHRCDGKNEAQAAQHDAQPGQHCCQPSEREQSLALRRLQGIEREEEQPEQQPKIRIERTADRDERTVHSSSHRKGKNAKVSRGYGLDV